MAMGGSAAYRYDALEAPWENERTFVAHEGGHLDGAARSGVSTRFVATVKLVVVAALALFVIGLASITLMAETVKLRHSNANTTTQINEVQLENDDLRLACSQLTRSERIARIATQNLGMTYATEAEELQF